MIYREQMEVYFNFLNDDEYKEKIKKVLDAYWEKMLKSPASSKYHSSHVGGLAEHTYNVVVKATMMLHDFVDGDKFLFLCLIHDLGKIDCYEVIEDPFLINAHTHKPSVTIKHKGSMDHIFYTIMRLQDIGIFLDEEEMNALVHHHGGWSLDKKGRGNIYSILLHCADMLAVRQEESEVKLEPRGI